MSTFTGTGHPALTEQPESLMPPISVGGLSPLVDRTLARMIATAGAGAIFGTPVTQGETTVIPCARISVGLGLGGGGGTAPNMAAEEHGAPMGEGGGAGGGAGGHPVAAIVVTPQGVHIKPIIDVNRIVLAGSMAAALMTFFIARAVRR
ncbi:MAG TPA: spore germination protein GerW family protein [Ktedonobacterales bacterium]